MNQNFFILIFVFISKNISKYINILRNIYAIYTAQILISMS